jgi:regulator of protease activity HflC (stomatin/prohibitin superfamily)
VARYANSATGVAGAAFMLLGILVAAVSWFQMRLEEREGLERLEFDELKRSEKGSSALFGEQAEDTFPARRSREQFERFFVPGFTLVLLGLQSVAVYFLWNRAGEDQPATVQQATVAMTVFGVIALSCFQFGKYASVLARIENARLLRPAASYLLLGAVLSVIAVVAEIAGWSGYPKADAVTARVIAVLLGLVAVENLLALIFEIYRPRVKGQVAHPLYESRLIGLLGQPGGLIKTAAQALDYQFGFKVSETWFYQFLEKALSWLILLQLGLLLVSTTVVFVNPGEQALLERFGKPVAGREVLGPGAHFKLPWPVDRVHRYQTDLIQGFRIGLVEDEEFEKQRVMLWTKAHAKEEFSMLVASQVDESDQSGGERTVPVNLLSVDIPVQYQVSDLRAFAYNHANAHQMLERLAYAVVSRYFVNVDFDTIMSVGRQQAAEELRTRIQARADLGNLGVRILFVGLHSVHPPVKIAPEFENVIGAFQDRETTNLFAQAVAAELLPLAEAEATEKTNRAEALRVRAIAGSAASAARFTNQIAAYRASPDVYRLRAYLDTVSRSIATARKYVVIPTNTHDVVTLNLEDKIREDILSELRVPAARGSTTTTNR